MKYLLILITLGFFSCDEKTNYTPKAYWINSIHKGVVINTREMYKISTLDSGVIYTTSIETWLWDKIQDGDTIINK